MNSRIPVVEPATGSSVRASEAIAGWRLTILNRSLWTAFLVSFAMVSAGLLFGGAAATRVAWQAMPGMCILAATLAWRGGPTRVRAATLIAGCMAVIMGAALERGFLLPNVFSAGILLCVLTAVIVDRRAAWLVVVGIVGLWCFIASLFVSGRPVPPNVFVDLSVTTNWVRVLSVHAMIIGATTGSVAYLVTRLEHALRNGEALRMAVEHEAEQKLAAQQEHHALEHRLHQSQKMESLGRLAGGVAHDFNNLLLVITGHADVLGEPGVDAQQARIDILDAVQRAHSLTSQLLAFSRQREQLSRPIDVAASTSATLSMLRRLLPETVTMRAELADDLPAAWGPPTAIEQILMNLCINARDAMPAGGELCVRSEVVRRCAPEEDGGATGTVREYILLSVCDTGSGIDELTMRRVFEPFFTTKKAGQGTGFGLSLVHGLTKQCGGFVEVTSVHGQGTRFDVYVAASEAPAPPAPPLTVASKAAQPSIESGHVLVVDDDASVRAVLVDTLRRAGFKVIQAENGAQGLALFQQAVHRIDIVVSDAVMPQMGGQTMYEHMAVLKSDLRFLVCSGHTADMFSDGFFQHPYHAFLPKPFHRAQLVDAVRQLLAAPPQRQSATAS